MDNKRKSSGITLISLVITILVLLIIVGISINSITGDNGVVQEAKNANYQTKEAEIIENIKLAYSKAQVEKYAGSNISVPNQMQNELETIYGVGNASVSDNGDGYYSIVINGKNYSIDGTISTSDPTIEEENNNPDTPVEQPVIYSVTFNSNGGNDISGQTINSGEKIVEPTVPTKAGGYVFVGWYKESTFENLWDFTTDTVTENKTLYAKWAEAIYFQMPPDWYGTTVYAYIHSSSDSIKDEDLPKNDSLLMTLKDSTKKIYQYKLTDSNVNNISTYNKVIFYNDGDLTSDDNLSQRRTIALNLTAADFRKVYVPELYNSSTEMRMFGYASTLYEYLWKEENSTQVGSSNASWPGIQMTSDTVDGKRFHQRIINLNTYNRLIINQGSGNNQSENITIPITYGSSTIAQDLTFKISTTKLPGESKKYYYKAFRCIYSGSWHTYDTWNSTEYGTWIQSGDGAKFQNAKTSLGYV